MKVYQIKGGKKIIVDVSALTVKKRREIRKNNTKAVVAVPEDKEVLKVLKEDWKKTPPTEQQIYEGFLKLRATPLEDTDKDEQFFEELSRGICRWEKEDGAPGEFLTREEYDLLPFDLAETILNCLFIKEEESFLEVSPIQTSA